VQRTFGITGSQAFMAALIGNVFMVVTCVFAGALSDKIGRK
jgi:MHS family proline/betaine transporter-like MFS transporter